MLCLFMLTMILMAQLVAGCSPYEQNSEWVFYMVEDYVEAERGSEPALEACEECKVIQKESRYTNKIQYASVYRYKCVGLTESEVEKILIYKVRDDGKPLSQAGFNMVAVFHSSETRLRFSKYVVFSEGRSVLVSLKNGRWLLSRDPEMQVMDTSIGIGIVDQKSDAIEYIESLGLPWEYRP